MNRNRQRRHGANSLVSVALLVGIIGLVNYLAVRHDRRWDMTVEGLNTLAEQSMAAADAIAGDVRIRAFYPGGQNGGVRRLLELYEERNSRIRHEFIDPDLEPQLAEQFEVTEYGLTANPLTGQGIAFGTLILERGERSERIETGAPASEEDITNALIRLARDRFETVYFIEGHGEKTVQGQEPEGLDTARARLEREGYTVGSINLIVDQTIPDDASVLVWPGPRTEPFEEEVAMVDAYLNAGGSVLVMLDPPPAASLESLLSRWSIEPGNDFVVDINSLGRLLGVGPEVPLVTEYAFHAITSRMHGTMTFFPLARSITAVGAPDGDVTTLEFLRSSARSWGETDLESTEAGMDPEVDRAGPVGIGVVATAGFADGPDGGETARLVVLGDSDFAGNGFFPQQGNGDLFLNIVRWLAEDESFISVSVRAPDDRPLLLTPTGAAVSGYLAIWLPFATVVALGILVWWTRRGDAANPRRGDPAS